MIFLYLEVEGAVAVDHAVGDLWRLVAARVAEDAVAEGKVARWQNLIPSFPWIAPGCRAWGRNPRKGRDQILQRSVAEP